jgi:hypothetical protein
MAEDERSWALIVEDIIRDNNIEQTQERMVKVYIETYEYERRARAYAFRSEAYAKEVLSEEVRRAATVIDGVYILTS